MTVVLAVAASLTIAAVVVLTAALTRTPPHTPPRPVPPTPRPSRRALALASAGRYIDLLEEGQLRQVGDPAPDPGNGDALTVLAADPYGIITGPDGRVLLVENAPTGHGGRTVHAIPVPPDTPDPITAAAWTYDDEHHPVRTTPALYAALARRT